MKPDNKPDSGSDVDYNGKERRKQIDWQTADVFETSIILRSQTPSHARFDLTGDVDALSASEILVIVSRELDDLDQTRAVILDFSGASYLDSAGIAALVELDHLARKRRRGFYLTGMHASPQRTLTTTRIDAILTVAPTLVNLLDAPDPEGNESNEDLKQALDVLQEGFLLKWL